MKLRKSRKLVSILLTLSFLVCLLVPMVGPAAASSTYAALAAPTVLNNDTTQNLGTIQIDIPQTTAGDSTLLVTLPTDFVIGFGAGTTPVVSVGKVGDGTFDGTLEAVAPFVAGIAKVSDREFKVQYNVAAGSEDYDLRLLVTLPNVKIPNSADGDITASLVSLAGNFSGGSVVVGKAGSGAVDASVSNTVTFTNSGTTGSAVEIYLKENSAGALKASATTAKFKLPKGMTWVGGTVDNITLGAGAADVLTAAPSTTDARVLVVNRTAATDGKSLYKVSADIAVDDSEAVIGAVEVAVSGNSTISPSTLTVGDYVDYSIDVVVVKEAKSVKPGRINQDVADFNIEEGAKGSIMNNRSITLELPEGVKWVTINDPAATGSLSVANSLSKVGTSGRKVKFTAGNTGGSKGKFKFENVQVDVAVDFSGDITVTVDGAGIDNQKVVIAEAVNILTATATAPDVKIGMQSQAAGTIKIVEGVKEALINGRDLEVVAPDGVKWSGVPTVAVIEGDLSISKDITKSNNTLYIPIKSQSTKASTIEITDAYFTVDRTVPEGYITLDITGEAVNEVNTAYGRNTNVGVINVAANWAYTTNNAGEAFAGRNVAASAEAAKTVTPAPGEEKSTAVFTIGSTDFTLNGVAQTMDAAPYIKNDRTYLPLRFVAKAVGVADNNIIWNDVERSVVLIKGDRVVKLVIDSNSLLINGVTTPMDVAPEIVDPGRTMLPVRWVAQAIGCEIDWDAATQTVTVN